MQRTERRSRATLSPDVCRSLALLAAGLHTVEVAAELGLDPGTVHHHVAEAKAAFGATSKLEAVVRALQLDLIELPYAD